MSWMFLRAVLDGFVVLFLSIWIILPAYVANAAVVPIASRLAGRPGGPSTRRFHALDGGRMLGGQRVLGDGKTVEGFLLGTGAGTALGLIQWLLAPVFLELVVTWHAFYVGLFVPVDHIGMLVGPSIATLARALVLPAGAMTGDVLGSFVKRRAGKPRGARVPLLDSLDFLAGAWLLGLLAWPTGGSMFHVPVLYQIVIACITPGIHVLVNRLAFEARVKDVPH